MIFEWDGRKADDNLAKHGIDFVQAQALFDGRPVITAKTPRNHEERFATTGEIDGDLYTVIWTWRDSAIRIISARRARDEERRRYCALHGGRA